jgi:2-polyprenyl-3-methyl-5-hydroxy-6-metoxy-1,4-benzoquinol methylase
MPCREGGFNRMEQLTRERRMQEPDRCQEHWYRLVASRFSGLTVLEVGAGSGYGMDILRAAGAAVTGIDPLPLRGDITDMPVSSFSAKSFDVVVACDVIEHVEDDVRFLAELVRVARKFVFISTPNWNISHAANQFHVREYTPEELSALLAKHARDLVRVDSFSSNGQCAVRSVANLNEVENNFGVLIELVLP